MPMSDNLLDNPALPSQAAELAEAWFISRVAAEPVRDSALEVEELVRYLAGALPVEQGSAIERALVVQTPARLLLREVRSALDRIQSASWQEAAAWAQGSDLEGQVARAWSVLLADRADAAPRAQEWWLSRGWSSVREGVASGAAEAQAAWAAFLVFAEQLHAQLQVPRLAAARAAGGRPRIIGTLPDGVTLGVANAEIADDGSLRVAVEVQGPSGPSVLLAGTRAFLGVAWGEAIWPLAAASVEGHRVEWEVPAFGSAAGLGSGAFPPECLALVVSGTAEVPSPRRLPLLAPVMDESGRPVGGRPAMVYVLPEPAAQQGELSIPLAVPPETRAAYRDYELRLDLVVGAREYQRLGEWPLQGWGSEPRTLSMPWPGHPAAGLSLVSLLRATLRPGSPQGFG